MELLDLVDAGEIDMAAIIRPPFSLHGDLRWTALAHEPFRLLVPRHVEGNDWAELPACRSRAFVTTTRRQVANGVHRLGHRRPDAVSRRFESSPVTVLVAHRVQRCLSRLSRITAA